MGSAFAAQAPGVRLRVGFDPLRLGAPTSVVLSVGFDSRAGVLPAPVASMEVGLPTDLGLLTSGLGLRACNPEVLVRRGARGCPPDSLMGNGSATVAVPFGPRVVSERVKLSLFASPSADGYLHLAILAHGGEPVVASIIFQAVLLPGRLRVTVPPIVGAPGGPDVSLTRMEVTLGGELTYFERVRGRTVAYHPKGILLPPRCPAGGWHVRAGFDFADGTRRRTNTTIRCPAGRATPAS